ncbi:MAG: MliC family protein [Caulobacterales bacterium]|nr:MliC family protein [Caulobacterales bacterium]
MRRLILISTLGLAVAGCATLPAPGTDSDSLSYRCAGGKGFTAAWNQPGDKVKVTAGGVTKSLPNARAASGARYAAGAFEIWGKGEEAMLSGFPGGPYSNCRVG